MTAIINLINFILPLPFLDAIIICHLSLTNYLYISYYIVNVVIFYVLYILRNSAFWLLIVVII